jgi:hypothetical protein
MQTLTAVWDGIVLAAAFEAARQGITDLYRGERWLGVVQVVLGTGIGALTLWEVWGLAQGC